MTDFDTILFYTNALNWPMPIDGGLCEKILGKDTQSHRALLVRLGSDASKGHWPICEQRFNSLSFNLPFTNGEVYNTTVFEGNTSCKDGPYTDYAMASLIGNRLADSYNILSHVDHATFEKLKVTDPAQIAAAFKAAVEAK